MTQDASTNVENSAMQAARDDAARAHQAAERAQQAAEKNVDAIRTVAIVAVAGLVLVAVIHVMRGKHQ